MVRLLRDLSLQAKLTVCFVTIVIFGTAVITSIGSRIITRAMLDQALRQVHHGISAAGILYAQRLEQVRTAVAAAASAENLARAAEQEASDHMQRVLSQMLDQKQLDFLTLYDPHRNVIVRRRGDASAQADARSTGALLVLLESAKAGQSIASTEILDAAALLREEPALAERLCPQDGRKAGAASTDLTEECGLVMIAAFPVSTGNGFTGVLYGGILLNHNSGLVDQIAKLTFSSEQTGGRDAGSVSIYMRDMRVSTTLFEADQRAVGARVVPQILDATLRRGEQWSGRTWLSNEWQLTAFEPIRNHAGHIVGILSVGLPERPFLAVRTAMMLTFLGVAALGILVVLGLTYWITRSMTHPLEEMVAASNRIAAGDLEQTVQVTSRDEIGYLAGAFNKMVASLRTMKLELEEWGKTLEEKVKKRSEELVTVQNQMAQSAKLASIGRLAAGVAHEINNPLGGILAFSSLALEDLPLDHPMRQNLEIVVKQTLRCRETVKGLLDFARQSAAQATPTDLNTVVDKTLSLLENQALFQNIHIVRDYGWNLPEVLIDPGQLQQVVVNIALNAVDAMEESGSLTVRTRRDAAHKLVMLKIEDTGKGIPEDILPLIFEPFFTTKKVGHGTGLGLSIVHGIVTRAGGSIEVESSPKGTSFTIRLLTTEQESNSKEPATSSSAEPAGNARLV